MEAALIGPLGRTVLGPAAVAIGRMSGNQIVMADSQSSSYHAEIRPAGQGYSIVDLGSTNGTYVNEERLAQGTPRLLVGGDSIRMGSTYFTYVMVGATNGAPTIYLGQPTYGAAPAPFSPGTLAAAPPPPAYQPYPPTQPHPARKKSRRGLWIALAGVIALLVVVSVAIGGANRSTPVKTLTTFCSDLKASDYQGAYQQLSAGLQGRESEAQFAAALNRAGGVNDCTFSGVAQNGSNATALVTLTLKVSILPSFNYNTTLIDEQDGWKIDALQGRR